MEFRLLGPVEASHRGERLSLGGPKPRALMAALLLSSGRVVSGERLVDALWGDRPPSSANALIQTYVYGLRRALVRAGHDHLLETRPPGYLIRPEPGQLDLRAFEHRVAEGRRHAADDRHDAAAEELRAALAMWRGSALGGIGNALRGEAERLEQTRLSVLEERISAELAANWEVELVGELTELVWAYPTRERLRGQLMTALYRLGRQADALTVYHEGRRSLADELGVDPGAELRHLFEAILRADPSLSRPSVPRAAGPRPSPVDASSATPSPANTTADPSVAPAQPSGQGEQRQEVVPGHLPRGVADFTGRGTQIAELTACLTAPSDTVTAGFSASSRFPEISP
ncbi:AfsR/SARP family transcriptional regulator, partial [Sphaerisporangium sp. NPDC049002]|uniref:AfsR/SARP family transcriptional regulator n=1 Tax=Sphaerisporangium sp. NPDC049002 TaxID=3155392 RepID=UPI0033CCBCFB